MKPDTNSCDNNWLTAVPPKVMSYQTWVKKEFYRKPKRLTYRQLFLAKGCYECDRICFYYKADYSSRKAAVLKFVFEEHYDGIFKNGYKEIIYYNPYNDARTYVYFGN